MNTNPPRNWTYITSVIIVHLFILGVIAISFRHIVHLFSGLGLNGFEAFTAPAFVDGFMLLGKLGRSERFAASTRRTGLWLMAGAGAVSLACNVLAGENLGQRIFGAMVVSGFVAAEWFAAKLKPAPAPAPTVSVEEQAALDLAAKRSESARKAAVTRKVNAVAKAKTAKPRAPRQRKPKVDAEHAKFEADLMNMIRDESARPVSPAPIGS